jgi:uncharacterized protein with NRDE domain
MCTLVAIVRAGGPLVVAANRDERLARPASGPRVWPGERFVAPRDEQAGGTWLGFTADGLFVGVTNRFGAPNDPARESRGVLVVEALRRRSATDVHASLAGLAPRRFNAFHLLYADARAAFVSWSDGDVVHQAELAPGIHVVTERSLGGDDHGRTEHVLADLRATASAPAPETLMAAMRRHDDDDPVAGTCIHVPAFGYGTRSSAVLYLEQPFAKSRAYFAEGSPRETPYVERPDLVAALVSGGGATAARS